MDHSFAETLLACGVSKMAWHVDPDVETIIRRAEDYRQSYIVNSGEFPNVFVLTPDESRVIHAAYGPAPMRIFSMEVRHPRLTPPPVSHARTWLHDRMSPMVPMAERGATVALDDLRVCETEVPPSTNMTQLLCPCGEVLWDLTLLPPDEESALPVEVPEVVADEVSDEAWLDAVETMIHDVNARRGKV